jgi:hypothetical protein
MQEMHDDDQREAIELGHEPIALSARAVAKGFSVLYGVVVVSLLLMGGLMFLFSRLAGGDATVEAPAQRHALPIGAPALDSDQSGTLRALRARERKILTEYAWVDADAGIARIPIRRAMEIMSQTAALPTQTPNNGPVQP